MSQESKKHFFISYNKADITWAEWIAWELEAAKYTTVLQAWDFRPGFNFVNRITQALTEAERVIAVLSPEYLAAKFTHPEWAAAFAEDPEGKRGLLLPVRVKECDLEGLLKQIVYIDLVGLDAEAAARRALLDGVRRERVMPPVRPIFPGAAQFSTPPSVFPGLLPALWNMPHKQNPYFLGRDELLNALRAALNSGRVEERRQAVHGRGGVGKTQIAIEYAYRYASEYSLIWWLRSEEPTVLAADYAGMYGKLELRPADTQEQKYMNDSVRRALEGRDGWLLIFDNVVKPEDLLEYLPNAGGGHVLVTSRAGGWDAVGVAGRELEPLSAEDSVEFLLKKTA